MQMNWVDCAAFLFVVVFTKRKRENKRIKGVILVPNK